MLVNDLQEALVNNINRRIDSGFFTYNKDHVLIKYLDKDDVVGLVPNPGSHMVSMDIAGEEYWQYNYSITMRTKSRAEAHNRLFELSQYLQLLNQTKDLISKNGSWVFDQIEVPNEPAEIQGDLQGAVTYSMDVAVFIYKQRGVF